MDGDITDDKNKYRLRCSVGSTAQKDSVKQHAVTPSPRYIVIPSGALRRQTRLPFKFSSAKSAESAELAALHCRLAMKAKPFASPKLLYNVMGQVFNAMC